MSHSIPSCLRCDVKHKSSTCLNPVIAFSLEYLNKPHDTNFFWFSFNVRGKKVTCAPAFFLFVVVVEISIHILWAPVKCFEQKAWAVDAGGSAKKMKKKTSALWTEFFYRKQLVAFVTHANFSSWHLKLWASFGRSCEVY